MAGALSFSPEHEDTQEVAIRYERISQSPAAKAYERALRLPARISCSRFTPHAAEIRKARQEAARRANVQGGFGALVRRLMGGAARHGHGWIPYGETSNSEDVIEWADDCETDVRLTEVYGMQSARGDIISSA